MFSGLLISFSPYDLLFVYRYDSHAAAATAICKTNGTEINGSILKVRSLPLSIIVVQFCFFWKFCAVRKLVSLATGLWRLFKELEQTSGLKNSDETKG